MEKNSEKYREVVNELTQLRFLAKETYAAIDNCEKLGLTNSAGYNKLCDNYTDMIAHITKLDAWVKQVDSLVPRSTKRKRINLSIFKINKNGTR